MPYADPTSDSAKEALRAYRRKWYAENKDHAIAKTVERKASIRDWVNSRKGCLSCERCGENDPICLDFHHKNPSEKEITIGHAVAHGWSIERLEAEIAKCEVVCANCHRKIHREDRGTGH